MKAHIKLPKGITTSKKSPGKYIAQYWSKELNTNIYIGKFSTVNEAVEARKNHIVAVHDGDIDDSLPRTKGLPKGIAFQKRGENSKGRYLSRLQIFHKGKIKDQHVTIHIGSFDTVKEAVQARLDFIENLK